jgi:peptide/nickel transport system ATP-binding protein/oligopeptide transport system ATP-binding protein
MPEPLLKVSNLSTYFYTYAGITKAVDDVSFSAENGEIIGIVGESGCGKSVMARSILRIIPDPPGRIVNGEVFFGGNDLLRLSEEEMQKIRGNHISMIFQEPMTSLNPVYTVGNQLSEVFRYHQGCNQREALENSVKLLRMVGMPSPETRVKDYPFQMSGGMRQRVVIAMALACKPKILLADEPTTALDVTIQAQVLDMVRQLQEELKTSMILITHDLGVIAEIVKRVLVMYAGKFVEEAGVEELFSGPLHPYTQGLMESIPTLDSDQTRHTGKLREIAGVVPDLSRLPAGCSFSPRCPRVMNICHTEEPQLLQAGLNHSVRCWLYAR